MSRFPSQNFWIKRCPHYLRPLMRHATGYDSWWSHVPRKKLPGKPIQAAPRHEAETIV